MKKIKNSLVNWNKYNNKSIIKINITKTQAIILPYNKSPKTTPSRSLVFGNDLIPISDDVK